MAKVNLGVKELCGINLWRAMLAEMLGTMFLTFIGCGTCIGKDWQKEPSTVQVSNLKDLISFIEHAHVYAKSHTVACTAANCGR